MAASAGTRMPAARRRIVAGAVAAACAIGCSAWLLLPGTARTAVTAHPFTISGAPDALTPGRPSPLDLTVTNPNAFRLRLTSLTVAVAPRTSRAGCVGDRDFGTSGLGIAVELPAHASSSLSALGVPRHRLPTVTAPAPSTRAACARARVTLRYAGTAVEAR